MDMIGQIVWWVGGVGETDLIPDGWLVADGRAVNVDDYPQLFALYGDVGTRSSKSRADGKFLLPDLRGYMAMGASQDDVSGTYIYVGTQTANVATGGAIASGAASTTNLAGGGTGGVGAHTHTVTFPVSIQMALIRAF